MSVIDVVNPAEQARRIIRYIGDEISPTGRYERCIEIPSDIHQEVGAASMDSVQEVLFQLRDAGLISLSGPEKNRDGVSVYRVNLKLEGWRHYEAEKRGVMGEFRTYNSRRNS